MQGAELERVGEAAPEVRRCEPAFRQLDADGGIAIMLDCGKERGKARGEPEEEGDEREPALLHRALSA